MGHVLEQLPYFLPELFLLLPVDVIAARLHLRVERIHPRRRPLMSAIDAELAIRGRSVRLASAVDVELAIVS